MGVSYQLQDILSKNGERHFYLDLSFWALIVSNLLVILWALIEKWSLGLIMWVYWSQSVAIGVLWFFKILSLKEFSTKGFKINGRSVGPTASTKVQTAVFFLVHYGFFHVVYAVFLCAELKPVRTWPIFFLAGVFFIYQCFSFFYNRKWDDKRKPNIGTMMFFPYARIIPMHFTIILGGTLTGDSYKSGIALALFMLLKTIADVVMHVVERRGFGDKPAKNEVQDS